MNRNRLSRTLAELQAEGTLDPEQKQAVEERLMAELFPKRDRMGLFVAIISMLGAILIGVGIVFFIAENWDRIGRGWKLGLIFGVLLICHHLAFVLTEKPGKYPRVGTALTALAVLCLGGALALVAQIYNLHSDYPSNLILVWWVLSVPYVLLTRSPAILAIVLILFGIWALWHTGNWIDLGDFDRDENYGAAFCLLALGLGALLRSLSCLAQGTRYAEFDLPFRLFASPAILVGLYVLSFREFFFDREAPGADWMSFLPFAIAGGLTVLLLLPCLRRPGIRTDVIDTGALLGCGVLFLMAIRFYPVCVFLLANLAILVVLLMLIARGVQRSLPAYINFSVGGFLIVVMTRYFEYLAERLSAFPAFLGAGALLLGSGFFLEKRRRDLIRRATESLP